VSLVMATYKKTVEGVTENGQDTADSNRRGTYRFNNLYIAS